MKITDLIAQHILDVHSGDNWTDVNIKETLSDVSFKEATEITPASANSIAMLLHHISFWNRVVLQRAKGIVPHIGADNGFDLMPLHSENDWKVLQKDNIDSANELAHVIREFDERALEKPILSKHSTAYKNFQGSVEHVHYHLGQMVIVKQFVKRAVEG